MKSFLISFFFLFFADTKQTEGCWGGAWLEGSPILQDETAYFFSSAEICTANCTT